MKQTPLLQGKALLIELPEGATNPIVDDYLLGYNLPPPKWAGDWGDDSYDTIKLPPGNWRIIGMLGEVTDGSLKDIVSTELIGAIGGIGGEYMYPNYLKSNLDGFDTALESLESAIRAEGYYLDENPIAVPDFSGGNIRFSETVEYAKAQSRVLDRSRCLLLGREA